VHAALHSLAEASPVVGELMSRMTDLGYSHTDRFSVRFALEEALANAITHAHQGDPTKLVHLSFLVMPDYVLVEVTDQGSGFDLSLLSNPMAIENRRRRHGRGIFLMRLFMTWVRFNSRGTRVTMCKMRSPARPDLNEKRKEWFARFVK
jgi:anti-sigma regulatory factor (Ser/Thr protein kinase)